MAKLLNWRIVVGLVLIFLSALVYFIHYLIFRDAHHIFMYLVGDIAFVFIEVLLVTMIIDQLLHAREKRSLLFKLNMIIGLFFTEAGRELIARLSTFYPDVEKIRNDLIMTDRWSREDFTNLEQRLETIDYRMDSQRGDLEGLRSFLVEKRDFFLRLLENPNLLEHEEFTDLLWGIVHLAEELMFRKDLAALPKTDYSHLSVDMRRAFTRLVRGWIRYMAHLKKDYPYLFHLAVRTNPFDPKAAPEVRE
jgi:hypothetical protein